MANTTACDCCDDETPTCYCPLEGVIDTLSKKYAMQLINIIGVHGALRFSNLETHLSTASTTTISDRLEELAEAGLITRTQYNEVPPRVEYELTDRGEELRDRVEPLLEWVAINA
jgi:DNA-binding HxlR family transcriptional regulator